MNVLALILFGSRARGDQSVNSDIDLLAVTETENPTVTGPPKAKLYHYSPRWLEAKALDGDLFIWHLISEASPIYDPADMLGSLNQQFCFKPTYDEQISFGSDVAWMIVRCGNQLPPSTANRWLAWSVRTISIARVAALRTPAFSANGLANLLKYPDISVLVAQKDAEAFSADIGTVLRSFLMTFGANEPSSHLRALSEFEGHFLHSGNQVGSEILAQGNRRETYP